MWNIDDCRYYPLPGIEEYPFLNGESPNLPDEIKKVEAIKKNHAQSLVTEKIENKDFFQKYYRNI